MILDNVTYDHQKANFFEANKQLKMLVSLSKGCFTAIDGKTSFDLGQLISNVGSPEFEDVEKFILKQVEVTDENGNRVLLSKLDEMNRHFNNHRSHYYQVILEGLKFHFLDFLPSGLASNLSTLNLAEVTAKAM